jgi:hypothetical protein
MVKWRYPLAIELEIDLHLELRSNPARLVCRLTSESCKVTSPFTEPFAKERINYAEGNPFCISMDEEGQK